MRMPLLVLPLVIASCDGSLGDCNTWPVCFEPTSSGSPPPPEPLWGLDPATGEFDRIYLVERGHSDPMYVAATADYCFHYWSNLEDAVVTVCNGSRLHVLGEPWIERVRGLTAWQDHGVFGIDGGNGSVFSLQHGSLVRLSQGVFFSRAGPMAYDPSRHIVYIAAREGPGALVAVHPFTRSHALVRGELTRGGEKIGSFPVVTAMAVHPTRRTLLLLAKDHATDILETDPDDPAPVLWKEDVAPQRLTGLAVDALGGRVFTLSGADVYAIDLATREATLVARKADPEGPFQSGASLAFSEPRGLLLFGYD